MPSRGKLIVFSAPSGSGKTTIVRALLQKPELNLAFSISATSREIRGNEIHGKDYYFLSPEEFKNAIENNEFLEWEEVYPGQYYGTLKAEVDRSRDQGKNVVFDIDVKGGMAAMLFAMLPDRVDAARFFAKMATAGFRSRECGHTGQGFSYLWGALGANAGGPDAAAAFFAEASWNFDLVRRCDG